MKRILTTLTLVLVCTFGVAQNVRTSFFGLNFGDKLTQEILEESIPGTFISNSDNHYSFKMVSDESSFWALVLVEADSEDCFTAISLVNLTDDESVAKAAINRNMSSLDYPWLEVDNNAWAYYDETGNTAMLYYRDNDDGTYQICERYIYEFIKDDNSLPNIQDEFFGIKLGSRITESSVCASVGDRGQFRKKEIDGSGNSYSFQDLMFAGNKWDFAYFDTNSKGELSMFTVNVSFKESNAREKKEAEKLYLTFKEKLDSKYGSVAETLTDNERKSVYYGKNPVFVKLSIETAKSVGGEYRIYVGLRYVQSDLLREINKALDDEL